MAPPLVREWIGIKEFPATTQTKLYELFGKLKTKKVSSLTILVMGKCGVGKSSTVNSLVGERVVAVSAFQSEVLRPVMVSRSWNGLTLNVIDTPGLTEGGCVNIALEIIKRFLSNKTIDVLLYVDRLDTYRVDGLDRQVVRAITNSFGRNIWSRSLVVLTHAQLSPPDGLNYDVFHFKRSEVLLEDVRSGAGFSREEFLESPIPVVLVENSSRCNTNDAGEKILPNGTSWIPNLVKIITDVISNESKAITVDKRSNPNNKVLLHYETDSRTYQVRYHEQGCAFVGATRSGLGQWQVLISVYMSGNCSFDSIICLVVHTFNSSSSSPRWKIRLLYVLEETVSFSMDNELRFLPKNTSHLKWT